MSNMVYPPFSLRTETELKKLPIGTILWEAGICGRTLIWRKHTLEGFSIYDVDKERRVYHADMTNLFDVAGLPSKDISYFIRNEEGRVPYGKRPSEVHEAIYFGYLFTNYFHAYAYHLKLAEAIKDPA